MSEQELESQVSMSQSDSYTQFFESPLPSDKTQDVQPGSPKTMPILDESVSSLEGEAFRAKSWIPPPMKTVDETHSSQAIETQEEAFALKIALPDGTVLEAIFQGEDDISLITILASGKLGVQTHTINLYFGELLLVTPRNIRNIPDIESGATINVVVDITRPTSEAKSLVNNDSCQMCGNDPVFVCLCKHLFFCQNCIGKHMAEEPSVNHIPAPIDSREIRRALAESAVDIKYLTQKAYEEEIMKSLADQGLVTSLDQNEERLKVTTEETIDRFQETIKDVHARMESAKDTVIRQVRDKRNFYEIAIQNARDTLGNRFQYEYDEILRTADESGELAYKFEMPNVDQCITDCMEILGFTPKPTSRSDIFFDSQRKGTGVELSRHNMLATNTAQSYATAVLNTYFEEQVAIVTVYIEKQSKYLRVGFVQDMRKKQRNEFLKYNSALNFWIWQANGDINSRDSKTKFQGYDTGDTLVFEFNSRYGTISIKKEGSNDGYVFENVSPRVLFSVNLYANGDQILLKDVVTQKLQ